MPYLRLCVEKKERLASGAVAVQQPLERALDQGLERDTLAFGAQAELRDELGRHRYSHLSAVVRDNSGSRAGVGPRMRRLVSPVGPLALLALVEDEVARRLVPVGDLGNGYRRPGAIGLSDLLLELRTEAGEQSGDDGRALGGQVTAVSLWRAQGAVAGAREEVAVLALRIEESVERGARGAQALLAGGTLIARLDIEKARRHLCDPRHADRVVVDDEPRGAEPRADERQRTELRRRVEAVGGDGRPRPPGEGGLEGAGLARAPRHFVEQLTQGDPGRPFVHAGSAHVAADSEEESAGRVVRAYGPERRCSVADDRGHVRERLGIADQRGIGRADRGEQSALVRWLVGGPGKGI